MDQQSFIGGFIDSGDIPVTYCSIRVTTPHSNWSAIEKLVEDCDWYISYPHSGKEGNNEHFHIFVPGGSVKDREKYRKRFKSAGYIGNKYIGVKFCENGLTSAISYGGKEGTTPITKGSGCAQWILEAPEWVERRVGVKRKSSDEYIELNCKNLMKLAFGYRQSESIKSSHLPYVMERMLDSGFYIMSPTLMRQGAPSWMISVFRESCEIGRIHWKNQLWMSGVFRDFNH